MDFRPTPVQRAREQVERQLRGAILSGTFAVGSKLPSEGQLAENFSVSRTTIRQALRALISEGLISKSAGASGGSFVRVVDHESLGDLIGESLENTLRFGGVSHEEVSGVRALLEVPSARLAAENRTEEDVALLRRIIDRQKDITVSDPQVAPLDMEFHTAVAEASGNRVLESFVAALHRVTVPVLFVKISPEIGSSTVRQHIAIVRGISAGDPEAAAAAMTEHLRYLEYLRSSEGRRTAEPDSDLRDSG